jgi:hypothetical protein
VVEHVECGAKLLAGADPLTLTPQAGTVGELRAAGLEGVCRLAVQGQRGFEVAIGLALVGEKRAASRGPGQRPGLGLGFRVVLEFSGYLGGLWSAAETQVDLG